MGAFISKREPVRLHFPKAKYKFLDRDEWIDVRPGIPTGQFLDDVKSPDDDDRAYQKVIDAIVAWSFEEGCTIENIRDLDSVITVAILEAVAKDSPFDVLSAQATAAA